MKIAVTGTTGLVGSRLLALLKNKFEFIELSRALGVNLLDKESLTSVLNNEKPEIVLHLAGKTNVDGCEDDKASDSEKIKSLDLLKGKSIDFEELNSGDFLNGTSAFAINTVGTKNIADATRFIGAKLIYISTDFIFDGEQEFYTEESPSSPINWYGQTKYWGEEVATLVDKLSIVRTSYPFGYKNSIKNDFVWTIIELLKKKEEVSLVSDFIITPTFIDDIALGIEHLINSNSDGVFNLTGSSSLTSCEIGEYIAKEMGFDMMKIKKIKGEEFYKDRARRPFKTIMKNDKLQHIGFTPKTFNEAFNLVSKNYENNP